MKVKTLRFKDTKEFVHIQEFGGKPCVFTSDLPHIQPMTATMELMKKMMKKAGDYEGLDLNLEEVELVEFNLIEVGEVGADIRNKLSPYNNLVALIELFLMEREHGKKVELKKFIRKEIIQSKKSIKYLAGLL